MKSESNHMRRYFLPLGALLGLAAIVGAVVFFFAGDPVTSAADDFFKTLAQQGGQAALTKTHAQFQRTVTPQTLAALSDRFGLKNYRKGEWSSRSVDGDKAELAGALSLGAAANLPTKLTLLKDDRGAWRVSYIFMQPASAQTPPTK
jgi:hypothetical protein